MDKRKYDFAGWVTKNDIQCSDGVTIKQDAFQADSGRKVPLVWNHDYSGPGNVLGHVVLHSLAEGVYGYGYFNDSEDAQRAKISVNAGDINAMSIGARNIKRRGQDVIHGQIYEVSLVMAGANPGAMIDSVMTHNDDGEGDKAVIYTDYLFHSAESLPSTEEENDVGDNSNGQTNESLTHAKDDDTIGAAIASMTEEQKDAVYALLGMVALAAEEENSIEQSDSNTYVPTSETLQNDNNQPKGDDTVMKHNIFAGTADGGATYTKAKESYEEVLKHALQTKAQSFKDLLHEQKDEVLKHGINSIEMLFPEAFQSTNGNVPLIYKDTNTAYVEILAAVNKSPFSRVKTTVADLTEDEARAKGYIKGNMKKDEFFSLIKRKTEPTTVYKKQKLDRDDIIDITDFDVVAFMNVEMQMMLKEEIARAILVGDGRDFSAEDKIDEQHIRPVISDNEFFTIHKSFADADAFVEAVINGMAEYRGSGRPSMYIDPTLLSAIKLLKGSDGHFLFGDIPSTEAIANRLGLDKIVPTTFMSGRGALIVNLRDYTIGANKGGEITNFDDFDIDFNQYKYLIETRCSGALTVPKSAIHLKQGTPGSGVGDADGGLVYGARSSTTTSTTTV